MEEFNKEESVTIPNFIRYKINKAGEIWDTQENKIINQCPISKNKHRLASFAYYAVNLHNGIRWRRGQYVHRLMAESFLSREYINMEVDHIDRDTLNNKVSNLRWVSISNQSANRPGWRKRIGLPKNVYRKGKKFMVCIRKDYKLRHYGTFATIEEARKIAREKRIEVFGEHAYVSE